MDEIKPRPGNPNEMTPEQEKALEYSIKNYDYNEPIVVDQNNILVNGEHRLEALKKLGYQSVDVLTVNITSEEHRKFLSQAMNKIHGEHDKGKDIPELTELLQADAEALQNLLNVNEDSLSLMADEWEQQQQAMRDLAEKEGGYDPVDENQGYGELKEGDRTVDSNPVSRHAETYLHGGIKQITLYFNNEEYQKVMGDIEQWMTAGNFQSTTELFKDMIKIYKERYPTNDVNSGTTETGDIAIRTEETT